MNEPAGLLYIWLSFFFQNTDPIDQSTWAYILLFPIPGGIDWKQLME